jgi:hypothetical protein
MFSNTLGISSHTFLKTRVFPALPTDRFNDNNCCFCWSPYNTTDHPGVRILPCDHVLGRDCLNTIVNAEGGDLCPLCRVSLFRPRFGRETGRFLRFYKWPILFVWCLICFGGIAMMVTLVVCHIETSSKCYYG